MSNSQDIKVINVANGRDVSFTPACHMNVGLPNSPIVIEAREIEIEPHRFSCYGRNEQFYCVFNIYVVSHSDKLVCVTGYYKAIGGVRVYPESKTLDGYYETKNNEDYKVVNINDTDGITDFFGWGDTAKALYKKAREELGINVGDAEMIA